MAAIGQNILAKITTVGAGLALEGTSFLLFGLLSMYFVYRSAKPSIEGTITQLKQFHGKYPSSDFTVVSGSGQLAAIHCDYNGASLQTGERIRVRYIQYNGDLLDADILAGPAAGWHHVESEGYIWGIALALMGAAFFIGGVREWNKTPRSEGRRSRPQR